MKSVTETATLSRLMGFVIALAAILLAPSPAAAQFTVPSDGSDGPFNPTANIQIDLGTAKTATWDTPADYNLQGVYDPEQWIVVYKFTSVNIPAGVTVTFKNHPKNPPVVWLVQGDVTINGVVSVDGQYGMWGFHATGGPGGFRGATGGPTTGGFGWGASNAWNGVPTGLVGNDGCFPLIGGVGGAPAEWWGPQNGGSGGAGAILIASGTRVVGGGAVTANSPGGPQTSPRQGQGGTIRIVAPQVSITSLSGTGVVPGRIRVESDAVLVANSQPASSIAPLPSPFVFLRGSLTPSIRIISIGGNAAPSDPMSAFASPTDVVVPNPQVQILLECRNVPSNATVRVELRSATNQNYTTVDATFQSGTTAQSTWMATGNLGTALGYATVMARAILPNP